MSGFEVPDFQTMRKSGKVSLDRSAYDLPHNTIQYHTVLHDLWKLSTRATPTAFHTLMDSIASDGRLLRHYTQNINCIEQSLPDLYERTVQLHGGINEVLCQYCGWNGLRISESFSEACPRCQEVALDREKRGKRSSGIGRLRPNMVLYGEEHPRGETIGATAEQDIRKGPDAVLVVGTALKVPGAKRLVRELCRAVKARDGLTIWISNALPPAALRISLDLVIRGDCDEVALLLSC